MFTLSVLAIALGTAVGSAYFFDVSMALGAFLAGMVVGQSEFSARTGSEALPLRDAFTHSTLGLSTTPRATPTMYSAKIERFCGRQHIGICPSPKNANRVPLYAGDRLVMVAESRVSRAG